MSPVTEALLQAGIIVFLINTVLDYLGRFADWLEHHRI